MGDVFDKEGNYLTIPITFYPVEFLQEEVDERELNKSDFAHEIGLKPGHLSELFKGRRHINGGFAVRLEKILDISAEFWLNMQTTYDFTELA